MARTKETFPVDSIPERDRQILQLVYEHRFLDTELLRHLIGKEPDEPGGFRVGADGRKRPTAYGFGMKALYKRLKRLSDERLLVPQMPSDRPRGRGYGGPRAAYGLGPASATAVAKMNGVSVQKIRDIVSANRVKSPFIRHALEVARFRVILELACARSAGRIRLVFWAQGGIMQDWVTGEDDSGEEVRYSVCPDAFFGLEVAGKGKAHYFLELDRGTMTIVSKQGGRDIRQKVFGYAAYRKARRHSERFRYRVLPDGTVVGLDIMPLKGADTAWKEPAAEPIKSFRVLFVAPGKTAERLSPQGRIANIIGAFPSFGKRFSTSTLFWFAPLEAFDIEEPETIFDRVWLTPNPEHDRKSLVE